MLPTYQEVITDLIRFEKKVLYVYDDATGQPVVKGYTLVGNPTIGIGRLLTMAHGISDNESTYLCVDDIDSNKADLDTQLSWWHTLDAVRQRVLINMCFNLGIDGLLGFHHMLDAMVDGNFQLAAAMGRKSLWYTQVGSGVGERGWALMQSLETGFWH